MKKLLQKEMIQYALIALVVLLIAFIGLGWWQYALLEDTNTSLKERIAVLEQTLGVTQGNLARTEGERENLSDELTAEKERVGSLAEQVEEVTGAVGVLDKLSKTDRELLQKYSKVYFLNEHYVPDSLRDIPLTHLYDESTPQQFHTKALPFLLDMIEDAAADGVTLWIKSAYRSFGTQSTLKTGYTVVYGSGANAFAADQGYSEHQLGTTADFTTRGRQGSLDGFETTEAYAWLTANAHKYGFTLSYPPGNAYYIFEPWHWRFVGVDLATELKSEGKGFYDADQREINQYLVNIFD